MPRTKRTATQRPIETYAHPDKQRANNPPVGLANPATDPDLGARQTYTYDPHLDPVLSWDQQIGRKEIEERYAQVRALTSAAEEAFQEFAKAKRDSVTEKELKLLQEKADSLISQASEAAIALEKPQLPYLQWAGKAEHTSFDVPTVSLHVHERIDPRTIIEAVRRVPDPNQPSQLSLFQTAAENPPLHEAVEFYRHAHGWSNRLVAGDSLLVMNSLLKKEGLAGKVQMIYIDPPYGIKYGSNFQPFVNKRSVTDGKDEDLTAEPEQIRAFRDTWQLGIHSYLTYLRDRLLLARELLTESGSVFVQISDENVHHVREIMDEVFGTKNCVSMISFAKTSGATAKQLATVSDYLIWYARDKRVVKYRQIYEDKPPIENPRERYVCIETPLGEVIDLSVAQKTGQAPIPEGRLLRLRPTDSQGATEDSNNPVYYQGRPVYPPQGRHWSVTSAGTQRVIDMGRCFLVGNTLRWKFYHDEFPYRQITNNWNDVTSSGFGESRLYVVQTVPTVIQRCLLMTTDPGDLVFDPTCGSGTTSLVAEQWGRRWITCDTSRVALTLAKQRLMTEIFDYYKLAHPDQGVGSGLVYTTAPHITLKSIANNEPPAIETLYDQPDIDRSKTRVSGPFTVEAVPAPAVKSIDDLLPSPIGRGVGGEGGEEVTRSGETLRQTEWRDELLRTGIRGKAGQYIRLARLEPLPGSRWLHADGETIPIASPPPGGTRGGERIVVSFGPEHAPLEKKQVEGALQEAMTLMPRPALIVFAAFQFDSQAAKDIDETKWPGVTLLKAQMNADLLTDDLKKKRASNESFWLIGQPDVTLERIPPLPPGEGRGEGIQYRVSVHGFDYYNTRTGTIESGGADKIAVWLLDTDYDGRSLYPRQVFFPMAGPKDGWYKLARNLKAEVDEDLLEAYRGAVSLPFPAGEHRQIAVKIVDDRGIESLKVLEV
jgi:adenine-specific DNA-methyltransferase